MHFASTAIQLATFIISVQCLPLNAPSRTPSSTHRFTKRGLPGAVYICTQRDFRGDCGWFPPSEACHIPGTGDQAPQSIGPDPGGFCVLYEDAFCKGNQLKTLQFPGIASNMPTFGGIKCLPNKENEDDLRRTGVLNGGAIAVVTVDDPRLAGGIGSMSRKGVRAQIEEMERDGFSQGLIGLRHGEYY